MGKSNKGSTSVEKVQHGIDLCEKNAKRLLHNAAILLDHNGSVGIAYGLWTLAVEEFGKAVLLTNQIAGRASEEIIDIDLSGHKERFKAGFDELPELYGKQLGRVLSVAHNGNISVDSIEDPRQPEIVVSVGAGAAGLFENLSDLSRGVDPTVELRFAFLYVDFKSGSWDRPDETFQKDKLAGAWQLEIADLRQAIQVLSGRVENRTR